MLTYSFHGGLLARPRPAIARETLRDESFVRAVAKKDRRRRIRFKLSAVKVAGVDLLFTALVIYR